MMKTPIKFITDLSSAEIEQLIENHQTHPDFRVRNRSHAILLSFEGSAIDQIAVICRVNRNTVSSWFDQWSNSKFDGLFDLARLGRPPSLTPEEEDQAIAIALENSRFVARQIPAIFAATGKQISALTLKNLLKKRLLWKRIKLGLWKKPAEDERIVAGQELDELLERAFGGEIDLIYFDQAGFNLWAKVVYAWQRRGERTVVPVMKGRLQNVLGFMWHRMLEIRVICF